MENFNTKESEIANNRVYLYTPSIQGDLWNKDNLFYRSLILDEHDKVVSVGWPKFFNYTEQPHLYPNPLDFNDWVIEEKLDGSLIIVSKYKGELVIRTRGVISAFDHETGDELQKLLDRNPNINNNEWVDSENFSLLFEHITPNNRIVLQYDNPELLLIGAIRHDDFKISKKSELDDIAFKIGVNRPRQYKFDSIQKIIELCETLQNFEGYVLSYNNNQNRVKLKTSSYLKLHSFKSNATIKNILELYAEQEFPTFKKFKKYILNQFDWECWQMVESMVEKIVEIKNELDISIDKVDTFVKDHKNLNDKDFAQMVWFTYTRPPWNSFAFCIRKGKDIQIRTIKKIIKERYENG